MANYKAIANGNWSNLAIWEDDGSGSWAASTVLPSSTDDVYLNGFDITTTNVDFILRSIRNDANVGLSISDGGTLTITTSGTYTFICDLYQGISDNLIYVNAAYSSIRYYNFVGNSYLGNTTATLFISNNVANVQRHYINYVGNIYGNVLNISKFFANTGAGVPNINAQLTGNFYAGGSYLLRMYSYSVGYTETFNLVGNAYASDYSYCFYLFGETGPKIDTVEGNLYPSATYPVLINVGKIRFTNSTLFANNTQNAIGFTSFFLPEIVGNFVWQLPSAGSIIAVSNNPDDMYSLESDTRSGVTYAGGTKTGTCAVPPASSVVKNVPVDDTVGTWAFDAELITRLQQCSTVPITGQQIANFQQP